MRLLIVLLSFHVFCSNLSSQKPLDPSTYHYCVLPNVAERGYLGYTDQLALWKSQVIPYDFSTDFPAPNRASVLAAISQLQENTNLCFVTRRNESSWIKFSRYSGFASHANLENNTVSLNAIDSTTVIHEIGHLLGMVHEHQRPDRGQHIAIHYQNIMPGWEFAFDIIPAVPDALLSHPYDMKSIMHYPSWAFSKNGASTITDVGWNQLEQNRVLSAGDTSFLNQVYPLEMDCETAEQQRPPKAGFGPKNVEDYCSFFLYNFNNSSIGANSIEWSAPGAIPESGSDSLFTLYFPNAGEFAVTVKATNAYGSDQQTIVYKVKDCEEPDILLLKPNPASNYLEFTLSRIIPADFTIRILSSNGQELLRKHGAPANLGDYSYLVNLPNLPQGVYMLVLDVYGTMLSRPFVVSR